MVLEFFKSASPQPSPCGEGVKGNTPTKYKIDFFILNDGCKDIG
jgi:hypothetical protein